LNKQEKKLFTLFKKQIISTYLKSNSGSKDVTKWSGENIVSFQEDLFAKVNTKVSEKWFYSYFKNDTEKLPRIDMLNILSKYIGYESWEDFKNKNSKKRKKIYLRLIIPLLLIFFIIFQKNKENTFHFCFYDEDRKEPIMVPVDIKILKKNESPLFFKSDKNGCFEYSTKSDFLEIVVSSIYYKTDTIKRKNTSKSIINLTTDDYTLMLDYYTNNNLKDWNKRKQELNKLIDNKAVIYQLYSKNIGVEIYTKNEFINLLTIPTNNLKKIKIISKEFKNDKIVKLKFIIR
jgi:hypothetical protein